MLRGSKQCALSRIKSLELRGFHQQFCVNDGSQDMLQRFKLQNESKHIATSKNILQQVKTYCNKSKHIGANRNYCGKPKLNRSEHIATSQIVTSQKILQRVKRYCNKSKRIATSQNVLQQVETYCNKSKHIATNRNYCGKPKHVAANRNLTMLRNLCRRERVVVAFPAFVFPQIQSSSKNRVRKLWSHKVILM
jgi:hypothetical protein